MTSVQRLGDICSQVIANNAQLLKQEGKHTEKAIQLLASRHLNTSILEVVDQRNWIKSLNLKASNLTDEGLARISALQGLTALNIAECVNVSDIGLIKFRSHHGSLDVSKTKISDEGVQALASCSNLELLDLSYTQVGDSSLIHFGGHARLQALFLRNTKVSNELFRNWTTNNKCPVALHTLIIPFTRVGDESAKAIAEIPSIALIDLKSTKYSQSGLFALRDGLKRKGVTAKLLPGNKLEVVSATRPTFVAAGNTFEWLTNAVSSFALLQGAYAQTQKRTTSNSPPTTFTRYSMFSSFSSLSLSSSMGDDMPSNPEKVVATPAPTSVAPPRAESPPKVSVPPQKPAKSEYDFPSDDDEDEDEEPPKPKPKSKQLKPTKSTPPPITKPDPKESRLVPKQPAKRVTSKPVITVPQVASCTPLNVAPSVTPIEVSAIVETPIVIPAATPVSLPDITLYDTPTVPLAVILPETPVATPEVISPTTPLATPTEIPITPTKIPTAVTPITSRRVKAAPKASRVPKVKVSDVLSDNKENEPLNTSGKRKSPRLLSKQSPKERKIDAKESTAKLQVQTKRKAATPKAANKRTKLRHALETIHVSPYHTRSSLVHELVTPPLDFISSKKQKKTSPSGPTPLAKIPPPLLDLDTSSILDVSILDVVSNSTDSFSVTYILESQPPTSGDVDISNNTELTSSVNLANCDLSIIASLADVNLHTSNDDVAPPTPIIADTPDLPISSPLSDVPMTMDTPSESLPPIIPDDSNTSVVPGTPSFSAPLPSIDEPLTPIKSTTPETDIDPPSDSPSPCPSTPTKQPSTPTEDPHTPPTSQPTQPATVPRAKPVPALFRPLTSANLLFPKSSALTPTRLNYATLRRLDTPLARTPTTPSSQTTRAQPATPRTAPALRRHPRTPTTPSRSIHRPTKPLTPAELERNRQLNHEFLRMRRLLLY